MSETRLVFATQTADPASPVLGPTIAKIRELAARVDEVVVLAAAVDRDALAPNCRSYSFAAPTQALRGARFGAALAAEMRRPPLAVVCHMSPVFALLAAPFAKPRRVPILLWFTQQGAGRKLALAERVVDTILSVDERSVPLRSPKVRAVGHGIDVAAFPCGGERSPPLRRLLGLGRYAPVKEWPTLLRAAAELDGASVTIHGPGDPGELRRLAAELGVEATFGGEVPYGRVPELLSEADALVNATRGASADKVVFEAAAACLPVFAASPVFDTLLPEGLRFPAGDQAALAARIRDYAGGAGPELRARVVAEHSAAHWAEAVLEAVA